MRRSTTIQWSRGATSSLCQTRRFAALGIVLPLIGGILGCGKDHSTAPDDAVPVLWSQQINTRVATLALDTRYNTIQLTATPLDKAKQPIADAPPATFVLLGVSQDDIVNGRANVTVSPTGLVTARHATLENPALIAVQQRVGNVTHVDTVRVQVTDIVPLHHIRTLTLALPPGQSVRVPMVDPAAPFTSGRTTILATASDSAGESLAVPIDYISSDSSIAVAVVPNTLVLKRPGTVTITARTTVYGVTKNASLNITVVRPRYQYVEVRAHTLRGSRDPVAYFDPATVQLAANAVVIWLNYSNLSVDLVFDDSTAVAAIPNTLNPFAWPTTSGNIALPASPDGSVTAGRYFVQPRKYTYHNRNDPTVTGTIIVE